MERVFGAGGALARALPGYRERASQLALAQAIYAALQEGKSLIAEAGTGTGKTFAYLVPALLAGGKVIVSTGTRTLQDQLFKRDIPMLRDALQLPLTVALLKGRSNYVCHYHLEQARLEGRFRDRAEVAHLQAVAAFVESSASGDIAELTSVPEHSGVWPLVTSTRDNCLGQQCPHHARCFVLTARKEALQADLVVVNHHLFFADIMLRDEGAGELLPQCNTVILDEAHQLPDTASTFFGQSLSTSQLIDLGRDAVAAALSSSVEMGDISDAAMALQKAARDLRLSISLKEGRLAQSQWSGHVGFEPALQHAFSCLDRLARQLASQEERSEALQAVAGQAQALLVEGGHWLEPGGEGEDRVRWVECFSQSLHLHATPLSLAPLLRPQWQSSPKSWVFTSATLSVKGDFTHYRQEMGLEAVEALSWESPFDYARHSLLYVPNGLPQPAHPDYTLAVVEAALPVLVASAGRAFMLFTSHRALKEAHRLLKERIETQSLPFVLLQQGETARSELLRRFRNTPGAVLLGTSAFWEGVDVKGEALSTVIIDKLPFAPPDDPVTAARIEAMNREGRNAFMSYQLPQAVIALKQGAGRLIRDETDRGVLMLCDPRLLEKPYGRRIWMSLPPMRRTRELSEVEAFFAAQEGEAQPG
ncbi:MAG: ATP-dependent DNA helicase [Betaproteobacteria bacterium]|nr:ATP-dependent DNA helicase [Betaproteobacteria bacterium]MDE2211375.1 ATP-dependent DNA helicase [Betaproteobacteria bacterium]